MSIVQRVHQYLQDHHIHYDTVTHSPSHSSVQSAIAAQVPLNQLAKAVVMKDQVDNLLMALIPATNRVRVQQVNELTATSLQLASEHELNKRFPDCETGAIPPLAEAYNMEMVWDNRLGKVPDIYFEAGDHETLIHVSQKDFQRLVSNKPHDDLCSTPARMIKDG